MRSAPTRISVALGALVALGLCAAATVRAAPPAFDGRADVAAYIEEVALAHEFDRAALQRLFRAAHRQAGVLAAMARPSTALPWHAYRAGVVTPARVRAGLDYWRRHARALARASSEAGVPPELIVATLGVETVYGRLTGRNRVFDALATLAFDYPPRAALFRGELTELLLLAREGGTDPLRFRGSYAGALGIPQFLPSSYRRYAVDFDGDGRRDLWSDADAIGSVANYYRVFGWTPGAPVLAPLERGAPPAEAFLRLVERGIRPHASVAEFRRAGATPAGALDDALLACAFAAETESGTAYWLGFDNFYVITRYNRSVNYAMAVYDLALELRRAHDGSGG